MKKFITSLSLALMLIFVFTNLTLAETTSDNVMVRTLTREQAIQRISEIRNISIKEASIKLNEIDQQSKKSTTYSQTNITPYAINSYQEYYSQKDLGMGFKVEVGALCGMASGGGYTQFEKVIDKWSKAIGSGNYTWDAFYTEAIILNSGQLSLRTRGNIEVTASQSLSTGFSAAGFEIGGSVGSNYYYRKTESISDTKTMSWYR